MNILQNVSPISHPFGTSFLLRPQALKITIHESIPKIRARIPPSLGCPYHHAAIHFSSYLNLISDDPDTPTANNNRPGDVAYGRRAATLLTVSMAAPFPPWWE
ncbi:hypothetical protein FA13DRAFT_1725863 [Coprinellus micaceus]|uniref:Uncharacterized protein n=1 Tax=Coprinellus micaceus TaxID=71717 RepID=A0A4Y7TW52_COPMI|nr:hypothetical protein FA13DRAFT_1725863 [Coprinellus micaceus]